MSYFLLTTESTVCLLFPKLVTTMEINQAGAKLHMRQSIQEWSSKVCGKQPLKNLR